MEDYFIISEKDRNYILSHPEDMRFIYGVMERSTPMSDELKKGREIVIKRLEQFIFLTQHREGYNGSNCVYSAQFDNLIESLRRDQA